VRQVRNRQKPDFGDSLLRHRRQSSLSLNRKHQSLCSSRLDGGRGFACRRSAVASDSNGIARRARERNQKFPAITLAEEEIYGLSFLEGRHPAFSLLRQCGQGVHFWSGRRAEDLALGQLQSTQEVEVSQDGTLHVDGSGAGFGVFPIEESKKRIIAALSQAYAGLVSRPPSIFFDLSLSKLRPVRVFLMGEVENPGGYFVNNFANVFNSLFVVGGPKRADHCEMSGLSGIIRSSEESICTITFLVLRRQSDARVNDNDIIFVPLRGRTVAITGEILRPAKYELLPDEKLEKIDRFLAAGCGQNIYLERAQVTRIIPFNERVKGELERRVFDNRSP